MVNVSSQALNDLDIDVTVSDSNGLAGPTIFPESNVYARDILFDIHNMPFGRIAIDSKLFGLINQELSRQQSGLRKNIDQSLSIILAQDGPWQIAYANLQMAPFKQERILQEGRDLTQLLHDQGNSIQKLGMQVIIAAVSEKPDWNYILSDERISKPINSFLFQATYGDKDSLHYGSLVTGLGFMEAKMWQKAIAGFERAIKLWPEGNRALYSNTIDRLAGCYENTGQIDKAIEILEALEKEGQATAVTHYNLGWAYDEKAGKRNRENDTWVQKTIRQYEKAIEINPKYEDAYYNLAELYLLMEKPQKAWQVANDAYKAGIDIKHQLSL